MNVWFTFFKYLKNTGKKKDNKMFYNKSSNKDLTDYGSTNITIVESTMNPDNECHVEDIARNIKVHVF